MFKRLLNVFNNLPEFQEPKETPTTEPATWTLQGLRADNQLTFDKALNILRGVTSRTKFKEMVGLPEGQRFYHEAPFWGTYALVLAEEIAELRKKLENKNAVS